MIMVSACLLGKNCKYSGGNNKNEKLLSLLCHHAVIPVCPEESGGLPTPRPPAEIINGQGTDVVEGHAKIKDKTGRDVTASFLAGANKLRELAEKEKISLAVLKERSPSCGVEKIYDGSFSGRIIPGCGVCTALLRQSGVKVVSEESPILESLLAEDAK